jgi:hypothetical protein
MFQSIVLLSYDKKSRQRKLVVNDPARGLCDRFHSFGTEAVEVDIEGSPLPAVRRMIEAAEGEGVKDEAGKGGVIETLKSALRPAGKIVRTTVVRK